MYDRRLVIQKKKKKKEGCCIAVGWERWREEISEEECE
jgi:hypothetical protein